MELHGWFETWGGWRDLDLEYNCHKDQSNKEEAVFMVTQSKRGNFLWLLEAHILISLIRSDPPVYMLS